MERCLGACNGDEPPRPDPAPCGDRCASAAERLAAACAERGGSDERCAELVAAFTERCAAHCEGDEGDGGDRRAKGLGDDQPTLAEDICQSVSIDLYDDCLAQGTNVQDCQSFQLSFNDTCVVELDGINDWLDLQASAPPRPFVRGDTNRDNEVDIADPITTLFGLFLGTGAYPFDCIDRVDVNDDGQADLTDAVNTLEYLFLGTRVLAAPFPAAGHDPTFDQEVCRE